MAGPDGGEKGVDRGILGDARAGFVHPLLADADRAGHDGALGFLAGLEIAAGDEELVEALFGGGHFVVGRKSRNGLNPSLFPRKDTAPAMPDDNLRAAIKEMMVENLMLKVTKEEIADDLPLFGPAGLGLDSIDALELAVSLEKRFGVALPNSEIARTALASVNALHDYVVANRKG